ncbi:MULTISPECIES: hypothetical protein [unclassified Streptomyces]|uniref:hypothetical protein n=1 Tax=unclassified Streptomyces TaxID=2593676 RepID=UPI002E2D86CE|nr:hypothetical protein [Streptomyces sp. NBC_01429]
MSIPVRVRATAAPRLLRAAVFTAVCVVLSATGHVMAACAPVPWWTLLIGFLGVFAVAVTLSGHARSTASIVVALAGGQFGLHSLFGLGQQRLTMSAARDDVLIRMAAKLVCGAGPGSLSPLDAQRIVADAGLSPAGSAGSVGFAGSVGSMGSAAGGIHQHLATGGTGGIAADVTNGLTAGAANGGMGGGMAGGLLPSLPMLLAHLLAALAAGWLLRHGDLALLRLGRLSAQGIGDVTDSAALRALRAAFALVRAMLAGLPGAIAPRPHAPRTSPVPPPLSGGETLQHSVIRRGPPAVFALAA